MKDVQLGSGGPPGTFAGAETWRAHASNAFALLLKSCSTQLKSSAADLTNTLLPCDCRLCSAPMLSLGNVRVCADCLASMAPSPTALAENLCSRCGDAIPPESFRFASARGVSECTACRLAPPAFQRAVAFAAYDAEMRELLHLLKFGQLQSVAHQTLATGLAETVFKLYPSTAADLVVIPVPLFHTRERARGFNQATLLASAAIQQLRRFTPEWHLHLEPNLLVRIKDTRSLYNLNPHQRRANLRGAFSVVDAEPLAGREVLLIDDIMTTGATARECARVLLRAGATTVWVATASRAQADGLRNTVEHQPADIAMWTTHTTLPIEPDVGRRTSF